MDQDVQHCGFSGNSDLYGLGIRLGVYLQWITSQIAVYFHLEGSNDLSGAYFIFSAALMIAVFVLTLDQEKSYSVEVVLILYMFFGGFISVRGYRTRSKRKLASSHWRSSLGSASITAMSVYGSWFWIQGESGSRFNRSPCGTIVFLVTKIPAKYFPRASRFFAALSIYLAVYIPCWMFFVYIEPIRKFARRMWNYQKEKASAEYGPLASFPLEVAQENFRDESSIGGASDVTSIMGRIKTSYRHLLWAWDTAINRTTPERSVIDVSHSPVYL